MPKVQAVNLTEKKVLAARAERGGRLEIWDAQAPGLCLRISQAGARTWVVRCRTRDGRQPRITLGPIAPAPEGLTLADARERAQDIRRQARRGADVATIASAPLAGDDVMMLNLRPTAPEGQRVGRDATPTVQEAWTRFRTSHLERKKRSPATVRNYADHMERLFADWHGRSLMEFGHNPRLLSDRHDRISAENGPAIANGAMRSFRAVYNHARKTCRILPADNPVSAVDWNPMARKDTAMGPEDLPDWFEQLAHLANPIRREFHLLTLLSGSRPDALKNVRLSDLDLRARVMRMVKPKGGETRAFDIPLSRPMIRSIIRLLRITTVIYPVNGREWLFPGEAPCGHMTEHGEDRTLLSHWGGDLRQTYRTLAQAAEVSEVDIHLLMNHSIAGVNAGYITRSKLMRGHLRKQQERLSSLIMGGARVGKAPLAPTVAAWLHGSSRQVRRTLLSADPDAVRKTSGPRAAVRKLEMQAARIVEQALPAVLIDAPSRRTREGRAQLLRNAGL